MSIRVFIVEDHLQQLAAIDSNVPDLWYVVAGTYIQSINKAAIPLGSPWERPLRNGMNIA